MQLSNELIAAYQQRAQNERNAGGTCSIDRTLPTVEITMSNGDEYFYQEAAATGLLATVPEGIHAADFLLASAQEW